MKATSDPFKYESLDSDSGESKFSRDRRKLFNSLIEPRLSCGDLAEIAPAVRAKARAMDGWGDHTLPLAVWEVCRAMALQALRANPTTAKRWAIVGDGFVIPGNYSKPIRQSIVDDLTKLFDAQFTGAKRWVTDDASGDTEEWSKHKKDSRAKAEKITKCLENQ